jgi:putative transposase
MMVDYRRCHVQRGLYFITMVTKDRFPFFKKRTTVDCFKLALIKIATKYQVTIDALVILNDHVHMNIKLNSGHGRISFIIQQIKYLMRIDSRVNCFWQDRYWEHCIRDENDYALHLDYIHFNPVKHGYVLKAVDYSDSSFHKFVKLGWYDVNWGELDSSLMMQENFE